MITNLKDLAQEVKESLEEYLMEVLDVEANASGFFQCLNPEHNDSSPSMHITPDCLHVKCFGCSALYDTTDLAAIRHNLDVEGEGFVQSVTEAATDLKLDFQLRPPTAEEIKNAIYYGLYQSIAEAVVDIDIDKEAYTPEIKEYVKARGWKMDTIKALGIGCLTSSTISKLPGIIPEGEPSPTSWMEKRDLRRSSDMVSIFSKNKLIFTQHNARGKAVGFTGRDILWEKGSKSPKYVNTSGTLIPIYDKSDLLYNLHNAKAEIRDRALQDIFVFEGQPDVVTSYNTGLKHCVAIGTSTMTERQAYHLKRSGATKIILCFDGDSAGVAGMIKTLNNFLTYFTGLKVYVKLMPEGQDPDSYIREHNREEFHKIPQLLAIDWLLEHHKERMEPDELAKHMVPFIASFHSAIERETLAKKLALTCDITTATILDEVNAIVYEKEHSIKNRIKEQLEDLHYEAKKNPENALALIDATRTEIEKIESEHETDHLSGDYFAQQMMTFRDENEVFEDVFPGFNMPLMPKFAEAFNNDWSTGSMMCIGGDENTGKTSFSCFLGYNLAIPEAENNIRVVYMTIDDSVKELYRKFVSISGKHRTQGYKGNPNGFDLQINHVVRPKYWAKRLRDIDPGLEESMWHAYRTGYDHILQLARQERLIMIGVPDVRNLQDFRRAMDRLRKKYPDDNLYAYLDNIHKLPLPNGDARIGFKEISNTIKDLSVEYDLAIGGTLEYNTDMSKRSKDGRPTNNSLAESRAFRYDANALVHMYNNLHVKGENSIFYHTEQQPWYNEPKKFPVVEAIIGKNKISDDKMPHFFKFYPGSSWFEYLDRAQAIRDAKEKEETLAGDSGFASSTMQENGGKWERKTAIER